MLKTKILAYSIVGSAFFIASAGLQAANTPAQQAGKSTAVQFSDLNLDRPGDVATLYGRITGAADRVCGSRAFTGLYSTLPQYQKCVAEALQNAVAAINRVPLTEFYRQQVSPDRSIKVARQ